MNRAAWLLIGSLLAGVALFGVPEATPAAAAAVVVVRPPRPPRAPRAVIATTALTASADPAAAGGFGKAVLKINPVDVTRSLDLAVDLPAARGLGIGSVQVSLDGTTVGTMGLDVFGNGALKLLINPASPASSPITAAIGAAGRGSKITVTTAAGALLLTGTLK